MLLLVKQVKVSLVKEVKLNRQRGRIMGIYTHMKVKDVKECISISIKK